MQRFAENDVNYQERATEFSVGDTVVPFGLWDSQSGRVTAVWPAIGMLDVEFPVGNRRFPVEDLQRMDNGMADPPDTDSSPGGGGTVSVPGGPYPKSANRVAQAFVKKSIYWAQKDRQYRMTRPESAGGSPACPKCGPEFPLQRAIYKRRDGSSERLQGCPGCMFLIKDADIVNFGPVSAEEIEITRNAAGGFVVKTNLGFLTGNRNNPGQTAKATHPQYVKVWRSRAQAQKWIDRHVDAGYGLNSDTAEVVPHAEVG